MLAQVVVELNSMVAELQARRDFDERVSAWLSCSGNVERFEAYCNEKNAKKAAPKRDPDDAGED